MIATEILEKMRESLGAAATVKTVFGEPIHAEGRTVVPVAKVAYGFGAGGGQGHGKHEKAGEGQTEGGGGGGGVRAFPAGALEISQTGTRFIPYPDIGRMAGIFAAGALLGVLLLRRKH